MAGRKGALKFNLFKDLFGLEIASESLSFSLKRDELESKYSKKSRTSSTPQKLKLNGLTIDSNSVTFDFGPNTLEFASISERLFHFTWLSKGTTLPKFRKDLTEAKEGGLEHFNLSYKNDVVLIEMGNVNISIDKKGSIEYKYRGDVLRNDLPPLISPSKVVHKSKVRTKSKFFGTGERALPFDLRGNKVILWNHDPNGSYGPGADPLYISIPTIIDIDTRVGYGIEYMNPSRGTIDLCKSKRNLLVTEFDSAGLEYYVAFGEMEEILEEFAKITGFPMLPPRWSLGFHQSKYSYMSQQQIEEIADNFQKLHLPISAIHMDIDYMDGFRVFTRNKNTFPDLKRLSHTFKTRGINLVSILDPAVKWDENYPVFNEIISNRGYVKDPEGKAIGAPVWAGKSVFPDFSSDKTQKWWSSLYSFFATNEINGVWHDMNEPAVFSLWGDNSLPQHAIHEKGTHTEIHNIYALYMAKAGYEGMTNNGDGQRPFLLSRSGWAGIQRYSFVWTGDTESTWAELKQTVPTILNLSLSGIPYTGVDIGGFSGTPSRSLFIRWFQLGSFLPLFRTHSAKGNGNREPWAYGEDVLEIIRKFLEIRYSLLPYWFSVAYESHKTGHPIIRPVSYLYPEIFEEHSFMVGDSILVYPVLEESVAKMTLKLPPGRWYSLWDSSVSEGEVTLLTDEKSFPVFIREGSVIPREDGKLHFDIYPGGNLKFTFYQDDDKLRPNFKIIKFTGKTEGNIFVIEYTTDGNLHNNEEISLELKNKDYVFKETKSSELTVSGQRGTIEIVPKN